MKLTIEKLNEMLSANEVSEYGFKKVMPRIIMVDGESISVQTGHTHYCTPRESYGPWFEVEIGYPSIDPGEKFAEYFDADWENDDHTDSVYGYVPIDIVVDFINEHGGIAEQED